MAEKSKLGKGILVAAVLALVAAFIYFEYSSYDASRAGASGDVYSGDSAPRSMRVVPSTAPAASTTTSTDSRSSDLPTPVPATGGMTAPAATTSTPADGAALVPQPGVKGTAGEPPAGDTISPNPPNGMAYAGKGRYQLYRQGNLTWRLDTDTGNTCVLFATDEEWKKPRVWRAGCGSSRR
ncbi:MAG: hypothetical protein KGK08_03185 [Acidobacteriota bacterium]|nr:hypothetical protein [Acidobacteriota bacterium]